MSVPKAKPPRAGKTNIGSPKTNFRVAKASSEADERAAAIYRLVENIGPLGTLWTADGKTIALAALIDNFTAAFDMSEATGNAVSFVVGTTPQGDYTIGPPTSARARLEAAISGEGSPESLAQALSAARDRGQLRVAEILNDRDMLSADDFAALLGTSRVTVNAKRRNNQVLGLEGAKRGFRFPRWQVGIDGKPFRELPELFDRLGGNPWAVYRFLVQRHAELDGLTGCDALRLGKAARVVEAAESVARGFA